MSTDLSLTTARKSARANLLIGWLDGGTLAVYNGLPPATADTAIDTQEKLVEFILPDPAGTVENGVFTLATGTPPGMILTDGTPTWARAYDAEGVEVGDFSVGAVGSGAAIIIDNANLIEGALVSLLPLTISEA